MQFHSPSVVQAPLSAEPDPVVPVPTGDAGAAELGAAEAIGLGSAAGVLATGEAEVASVVAAGEAAVVAKTPPERTGAEEAAGAEATGEAADVGAGAADDPPLLPPAAAVGQVPAGAEGVAVEVPRDSTAEPGSGNARSAESTVVQPLPTLATNMFGKASKAELRLMIWV